MSLVPLPKYRTQPAGQALFLLLAPLVLVATWWVILCVLARELVFPPVWLILASLAVLFLGVGILLVLARMIVFGFFKALVQRLRPKLEDLPPFLFFSPGQELTLLNQAMLDWNQELEREAKKLTNQSGLWKLKPPARFSWAGKSRLYGLKSSELKKLRSRQEVRSVACLGVLVRLPAKERSEIKRFDYLSELAGSLAGLAEEQSGLLVQVEGNLLVFVFSLGRDERGLAIRAARAGHRMLELVKRDYPGAGLQVVGDLFLAYEAIIQSATGLRYHIESPELADLRQASGTTNFDPGLRLSSRLVARLRAEEAK